MTDGSGLYSSLVERIHYSLALRPVPHEHRRGLGLTVLRPLPDNLGQVVELFGDRRARVGDDVGAATGRPVPRQLVIVIAVEVDVKSAL